MHDPATDAQTPPEADLEKQVESLLSDMTHAVEEIQSKLGETPDPEEGDVSHDTPLDDAGTGETEPVAEQTDASEEASAEEESADEIQAVVEEGFADETESPPEPGNSESESTESIDEQIEDLVTEQPDTPESGTTESAETETEVEHEAVGDHAPAPEAIAEIEDDRMPEASSDSPHAMETPETGANDAAPSDEPGGEAVETDGGLVGDPAEEDAAEMPDDPDSPDAEGSPASGSVTPPDMLNEVQAELEQVLAESESDVLDVQEPTEEIGDTGASTETGVDTGVEAGTATDEISSGDDADEAGADDSSPDTPSSADSVETEPAVPEYGDIESLDDELAALACDALEEDLDFDDPLPAGDTDKPAGMNKPDTEPPATGDPEQAPEPSPEEVEAVAEDSPAPAAVESGHTAPKAAPGRTAKPKPEPGTLRWDWLPPKPEWEEVYSRWRVAIIAWRHLVWIVPPLAVFLGRWIIGHVVRLEPVLLKIAAAIAAPLAKRDARTRSVVGWFAIYTFFCAACLWAYVLWGRTSTPPETTASPVMLEGEHAVAEGGPNP